MRDCAATFVHQVKGTRELERNLCTTNVIISSHGDHRIWRATATLPVLTSRGYHEGPPPPRCRNRPAHAYDDSGVSLLSARHLPTSQPKAAVTCLFLPPRWPPSRLATYLHLGQALPQPTCACRHRETHSHHHGLPLTRETLVSATVKGLRLPLQRRGRAQRSGNRFAPDADFMDDSIDRQFSSTSLPFVGPLPQSLAVATAMEPLVCNLAAHHC